MAEAPSGLIGDAFVDVRNSLARCASFQAWAKVTDSTEALEFIHFYECDTPVSNEDSPDLVVTVEPYRPGLWFSNVAGRGTPAYDFGGSLTIHFQSVTSENYLDDPESAFAEHINRSGSVIQSLLKEMFDEGRPPSQGIEIIPAQPNEKNNTGRAYQESWWRIDWGCQRINVQ